MCTSIEETLSSEKLKKGLKDAELYVQYINQKFITINDEDHKTYAEDLKQVLSQLITHMKQSDPVFMAYYQKERFAGSYADGLKIGKPAEYDLNLIIKLPLQYSNLQLEEATPSFVKINAGKALEAAGAGAYENILLWIDKDNYILQNKFREWIESVLAKAFKALPTCDGADKNTKVLSVEKGGDHLEYKINYKKSGPAMTVNVTTMTDVIIDVDLVPAFEFEHPIWPKSIRELPKNCKKKFWMTIPKPKRLKEGDKPNPEDDREWRISFLDQERELLHDSGTVKPTIKLLKKLRDTTKTVKLSSYAIKSVVLWEMNDKGSAFWKNRVMYTFLVMLSRLVDHIKNKRIPFFWDERDNLLNIGEKQCENICGQLSNVLKDILRQLESNPRVVAEKLLSKNEFSDGEKERFGLPNLDTSLTVSRSASLLSPPSGSLDSFGYMAKAIGYNQSGPFSPETGDILTKVFQKFDEVLDSQKKSTDLILKAFHESKQESKSLRTRNSQDLSEADELRTRVLNLEETVQLLQMQLKDLKKS